MLSKFNNKKHRRLTAMLLCAALMLGSVTSVSADISAADSETEVQNYAEEPTTEAVSYGAPEAQTEVSEETKVSEEVQLTQDMKNAEGKTICKVIADLSEGAFNADASEITMEVKAVSSEDEEAIVKLIKNALQRIPLLATL